VGGFQDLVHDTGQVITDRIQGDRVFQPARERGHSLGPFRERYRSMRDGAVFAGTAACAYGT